ncbi:hypothetical protein NC653_022200 [Populus alba x Populus x berolinensis]|uniref:Uncharacterized protein n=1 Tax=Populus alba x Populus x berolinensis TaxID=444605 RepID=A0AAD6QFS6_9ROSI|nr:hypothetical protein NC653_022200 [Populus alba x Populus x berolinensis]
MLLMNLAKDDKQNDVCIGVEGATRGNFHEAFWFLRASRKLKVALVIMPGSTSCSQLLGNRRLYFWTCVRVEWLVLTPQNLKVCLQNVFLLSFINGFPISLKFFLGSEFRVAFEEARKYEGKGQLGGYDFGLPIACLVATAAPNFSTHICDFLVQNLHLMPVSLYPSIVLNNLLQKKRGAKRIWMMFDMLTLVIQRNEQAVPQLIWITLVHERDHSEGSCIFLGVAVAGVAIVSGFLPFTQEISQVGQSTQ